MAGRTCSTLLYVSEPLWDCRYKKTPRWRTTATQHSPVTPDSRFGAAPYRRLSEGGGKKPLGCKGFCVVDMSSTGGPSGPRGQSRQVQPKDPADVAANRWGGQLVVAVTDFRVWELVGSKSLLPAEMRPRLKTAPCKVENAGGGQVTDQRGLMRVHRAPARAVAETSMTSSTLKTPLQITSQWASETGPKRPCQLHQRRPKPGFR